MKKWTLYRVACIINAIAATTIMGILVHKIIDDPVDFQNNGVGVFFILIVIYAIYIIADYWGLILYHRYYKRNAGNLEVKGIISVILFFHCIVLVSTGFYVTQIIMRLLAGLNNNTVQMRISYDIYALMSLLIIIVFISALIIFPSTIILLRATKENRLSLTDEIDTIGIDTSA